VDAGPPPMTGLEQFASFSKVPFAGAGNLQGMSTPYFGDSHNALRKACRKFFVEETLEEALECEVSMKPPSKETRMKMGELGIIAMRQGPGKHLHLVPGGLCGGVVKPDEFNYFHELIVHEESTRSMCPGYDDGLDAACTIGVPVIIKYGADWLKQEVLPQIFSGEKVCSLAISEAFAGSDVAAMRTRAELDAKGENYILNGTKKWITGGMYSDYFVTACRTGGKGAGGISMILVPRTDAIQTKVIKSKY